MAGRTITADSTEFVTLVELKKHLNMPLGSTSDDAELTLIRDAAQETVEGLVGAVLWRTRTQAVTANRLGVGLLSWTPVLTVDAVTVAGSPFTGFTYSAGLEYVTGLNASGKATVTYTVGRAEVPFAVVLATLIVAAHLWQTQRGNAPATGLQGEPLDTPNVGLSYGIPNRALDLLQPYLLPPSVG